MIRNPATGNGSFARLGADLSALGQELMKTSDPRVPYRNAILASLSPGVLSLLQGHLAPVKLKVGQDLLNPEEPSQAVYFPESGIVSMVVTMKDGRTIEAGVSGRDNFIGTSAILSGVNPPHRVFVQVSGAGYRVTASIVREQLSEPSGELRAMLLRGLEALLIQSAQTTACNRVHEIEERLARWLLMCHDRLDDDRIALTHEFLATMLGTRRSTVSVAAAILQKADFIDHHRGQVIVKNRQGLEDATCECYAIIRGEYERLGLLPSSSAPANH